MASSRFIAATFLLICLAVRSVECEECLTGSATCTGKNNTVTLNTTTVCCADADTVPDAQQSAEGVVNCTCVYRDPGKSLEELIQAWAKATDSLGRMCQFGEDGCSGSWSNTTINNRFKFCCRKKPSFENMTMYNGHNESYIGCRCVNDTIPTNTDPDAYVVPQTGLFNSTGEDCGYNEVCNDYPSLKCESPQATFCCYGSRGMKLTDNGTVTSCTCTHEFLGKQCVADIKPIPGSVKLAACLNQCNHRLDSEKCQGDDGESRCCPDHMTVNATLDNGNFTICTCSTILQKKLCQTADTSAAAHSVIHSVIGLVVGAAWLSMSL